MLSTVIYEQPTEYRVPMVYVTGVTTLARVQAEITRGQDSRSLVRKIDYKVQLHTQAINTMSTFNLATQSVFSITQDWVYNYKFGGIITGVVNIPKAQIKVTIERPEFGEPMSMMMHSRVYKLTRGN